MALLKGTFKKMAGKLRKRQLAEDDLEDDDAQHTTKKHPKTVPNPVGNPACLTLPNSEATPLTLVISPSSESVTCHSSNGPACKHTILNATKSGVALSPVPASHYDDGDRLSPESSSFQSGGAATAIGPPDSPNDWIAPPQLQSLAVSTLGHRGRFLARLIKADGKSTRAKTAADTAFPRGRSEDSEQSQQQHMGSVKMAPNTSSAQHMSRASDVAANSDGGQGDERDTESNDLTAWGRNLLGKKCPRCQRRLIIKAADVVYRTRKLLIEDHFLHPVYACTRCNLKTCVGCGKQHDVPEAVRPYASGMGFKVGYCCDEGRLFLVWALACGPDFIDTVKPEVPSGSWTNRLRSGSSSQTGPGAPPSSLAKYFGAKSKTTALSESTENMGSSSSSPAMSAQNTKKPLPPTRSKEAPIAKGVGYSNFSISKTAAHNMAGLGSSNPKQKLKDAKKADDNLRIYLQALTILLPYVGRHQASSFDYTEEHPLIHASLGRSPMIPQVSEVLRSICIDELEARKETFEVIAAFLERMAGHSSTFAFLCEELVIYPVSHQLIHFTLHPRMARDSSSSSPIKSSSSGIYTAGKFTHAIRDLLVEADKVCSHYVRMVTTIPGGSSEEDIGPTVTLCKRFQHISQAVEANIAAISDSHRNGVQSKFGNSERRASKTIVTRAKAAEGEVVAHRAEMEDWLRVHSVEEVSDERLLETFHFRTRIGELEKCGTHPDRKKLMRQISALHTSLPQGIFVRYSSRYLGAMKILIIGPEDTPYENGIFEFDMLCGGDFPAVPPEMSFRTTGGGRVRFNPNLYQDGRVCLSLLGTWNGEPWDPTKSTLLQVLVSIQAMILNQEPWYNEPGSALLRNENASVNYNKQIQNHTITHAMVYWLTERLAVGRQQPAQPVKSLSTAADPRSFVASKSGVGPASTNPASNTSLAPTKTLPTTTATHSPTSLEASTITWPSIPGMGPENPGGGIFWAWNSSGSHNLPPSSSLGADLKTSTWTSQSGLAPSFSVKTGTGIPMTPFSLTPSSYGGPARNVGDRTTVRDRADDCVWGEMLRRHFALRGHAMLETAERWKLTSGDTNGNWSSMVWAVQKLEEELKTHGFV